MRISDLFEEKPEQWGLRGDPYLWEDMKEEFASVPISVSAEAFSKMFYAAFEKLVKVPLSPGIFPYCLKYAHGGMASGKISGDFWIETALPLLVGRLEMYHIFKISNK